MEKFFEDLIAELSINDPLGIFSGDVKNDTIVKTRTIVYKDGKKVEDKEEVVKDGKVTVSDNLEKEKKEVENNNDGKTCGCDGSCLNCKKDENTIPTAVDTQFKDEVLKEINAIREEANSLKKIVAELRNENIALTNENNVLKEKLIKIQNIFG